MYGRQAAHVLVFNLATCASVRAFGLSLSSRHQHKRIGLTTPSNRSCGGAPIHLQVARDGMRGTWMIYAVVQVPLCILLFKFSVTTGSHQHTQQSFIPLSHTQRSTKFSLLQRCRSCSAMSCASESICSRWLPTYFSRSLSLFLSLSLLLSLRRSCSLFVLLAKQTEAFNN